MLCRRMESFCQCEVCESGGLWPFICGDVIPPDLWNRRTKVAERVAYFACSTADATVLGALSAQVKRGLFAKFAYVAG